jgi:hypothetical protein
MKISKPTRPKEPNPDDCCGSGCARCVWDVYSEALERYEDQLKLWKSSKIADRLMMRIVWCWRPRSVPDSVIQIISKHLIEVESLDCDSETPASNGIVDIRH